MLIYAFLLFVVAIPVIIALADFFTFLSAGKRTFWGESGILDLAIIVFLPFIYVFIYDTGPNDCCDELFTATFSPKHRLTIYTSIIICVLNYFYCFNRDKIHSPVLEVVSNSLLLIAIVLNVFIGLHISPISFVVIVPIILLFLIRLIINHRQFLSYYAEMGDQTQDDYERMALKILKSNVFLKYPVLLLLCIPILTVITAFLLIFGQKPDSLISAFTETYRHGFSQYDCNNVACGGHYLCSVAANGHTKIVKPIRYGMRHGNRIICNRQLLISNAFEELVAEIAPKSHKVIRRNYDRVGDFVHAYYDVFNIKWVSDVVYILMKPLEWLFLLVLYTFDRKPENRIAKQYLK